MDEVPLYSVYTVGRSGPLESTSEPNEKKQQSCPDRKRGEKETNTWRKRAKAISWGKQIMIFPGIGLQSNAFK